MSAKQAERERRKAARRRMVLRRAAIVTVVVTVVVAAWIVLLNSPVFMIEEIRVEGAHELSDQEVIAIAAIGEDATLLNVDEEAAVARLKQVPWIAEADLVKLFPSTALISIEERQRFAMVDAGATFWAVDRDGRVLGESLPDTATPLPVIRDVVDLDPVAGEVTGSEALQNALKVLRGVSPELLSMVRVVSSPSVEETALLTDTNVEVMLGRAEQLTEKSALALEIMQEQGSGIVFIDVRSLERPISRGLSE